MDLEDLESPQQSRFESGIPTWLIIVLAALIFPASWGVEELIFPPIQQEGILVFLWEIPLKFQSYYLYLEQIDYKPLVYHRVLEASSVGDFFHGIATQSGLLLETCILMSPLMIFVCGARMILKMMYDQILEPALWYVCLIGLLTVFFQAAHYVQH